MNHITLALPYALPPAEMAPDLLRALDTPALAALLSRHNKLHINNYNNDSRVLPHEAWLAHALGLAPAPRSSNPNAAAHASTGAGAPLAIAAMRGLGLGSEAASGHWFMLQPAFIQLSRTHMLLSDPRQLHLRETESRALYEIARPYFEELDMPLLYAAPDLWFVRADRWAGLRTASPDAAVAQNLSDWLPEGDHARDYRKLQNEIQMLWHEHPVNQQRQARGLTAVNSFWLWGGAGAGSSTSGDAATAATATAAPAGVSTGQATTLAVGGAPVWMAALAAPERRQPDVAQLIARPGTVVLAELIPSAQAGDWADWLARLQRIEQEWFAPLLAALKDGRVDRVTLLLSHRTIWLSVDSGKLAQRKFWRKPSLNLLLKQA